MRPLKVAPGRQDHSPGRSYGISVVLSLDRRFFTVEVLRAERRAKSTEVAFLSGDFSRFVKILCLYRQVDKVTILKINTMFHRIVLVFASFCTTGWIFGGFPSMFSGKRRGCLSD